MSDSRTYATEVQSNGKLKRGPMVSVPVREFSDPIPDRILMLLDDAELVIDDNDYTYIAYDAGERVGVVWGPAVEGDWFVGVDGRDASRVPTRDGALTDLIDAIVMGGAA